MPLTAQRPTQELVDLVAALGGTWHGYTAMCRCPSHPDRTPSLSLRQGDRAILVTCFAGCDRRDILRDLKFLAPHEHGSSPPRHAAPGRIAAARIWGEGRPNKGTLAARYLALRDIPDTACDLRYHPRCPLGPKPHTIYMPALLAAVREGTHLTAILRIFLNSDATGYTRKLMLGHPGKGAWQGAPATHTLALAEGIEKAAAFNLLSGIPTWSSLGARRLPLLALPAGLTTLIIAQDNDPEGMEAGARAARRYRRGDLLIRRIAPPRQGDDWSDVLGARGKREGG